MTTQAKIKCLIVGSTSFLVLIANIAVAQSLITISGHVLSAGRNPNPIPGAKITASGIEIAPVISDSSGLYVITVHTVQGQPIHFRVERSAYLILDEFRPVAPPIPVDFVLRPNASMTNKVAITALNKGLKSVDKVYRQLECDKPPCVASTQPFPIEIRENRGTTGDINSLDFVRQSGPAGSPGTVLGTISDQDISRLTDDQKVMIVVYEESVEENFDVWTSLSSQLQNGTVSADARASVASQLLTAGREMCGNFENMLDVLQNINVQVWDHYASIRQVCYQFKQAHIGG